MPIITDVAATLSRPGFWSSYYGTQVADTDEEVLTGLLVRVLGDDPDFGFEGLWGPDPYEVITEDMDGQEQDRAMEEAMAAGAVLRMPFPSGHTWSIQFSSSPGIYHELDEPDGMGQISLGYDDPHFHLPILCWAEAWRIAEHFGRHPAAGDPAPFPAGFVLPLLAPVTSASSPDEAEEARRRLADAWIGTGMIAPEKAAELADQLVRCGIVWRPDPVYGWINNGRYSHRNPANGFWPPAAFATFRRFLDCLDIDAPATLSAEAGTGTGTAPEAASARWRFDADGPVEPTVTVAGNQVYCFTSKDAKLRALDASTGRQHWYTGIMDRGFGHNTVAAADGLVHYCGGNRGLDLVAFNEHASGEADVVSVHPVGADRVRYNSSGAYGGWADTTPVLTDERVLVAEDKLYAWRLTPSGPESDWDAYLPGPWTPRSRPVVVSDRVYVAVGEDYRDTSAVQAFDIATGEPVRKEIEVTGTAQDLVADGDELFVAADALTVFDSATGATRWSVATERQWSGAIGVTGDWVVGTTCRLPPASPTEGPEWQYTMVGIDRHRREVAWTFTAPERLASRGVILDGQTAYSVGYSDHDATLYAVDLITGVLQWQHPLGRSTCLPAVADATVYVSTADGAVLALRAGKPS